MGDICCTNTIVDDGPNETNSSKVLQIFNSNHTIQNQESHEPILPFARPYDEDIKFLSSIDKTIAKLGSFNYPEGSGAPKGHRIASSYKLQNGIIYNGEWKHGRIHGRGLYLLPDQSILFCLTNNNLICGNGRVIYNNGDYFQGNIENGKANGYGKYVQGKITYVGYFKDNIPHGEGVEQAEDYQFQGEYSFGQKKYGKLTWSEEQKQFEYIGSLSNGLFQGRGTLTTMEDKYVGQFKKGLKQGFGKYFYKNHRYYQGQFLRDKRHGEGKIIDEIKATVAMTGKWFNDIYIQQ